jgi:hypothetical protein
MAETAQGLKGKVLRIFFVLLMKSWIFTIFHFFLAHGSTWCHLQCHRYDLNVKIYKVHSVEVLSQDPRQQNEF